MGTVNIAVEGCCHGQLDDIYRCITRHEASGNPKVDILLICGDFECVRDLNDLNCLAVPQKYRKLNTFHQYVTGEKVAPVLTVFVGGNHEASNILQELYYGGWVAPNIYFLGFAGSIRFGGLRISGVSGIYNGRHYQCGHFEYPPYSEDTKRSIYHTRELEIFRLSHLPKNETDIMLSHDWPSGIWEHGDRQALLRKKPFFKDDIASGRLGSPPLMQTLVHLKPRWWFAAHLHTKFAATVRHAPAAVTNITRAPTTLPALPLESPTPSALTSCPAGQPPPPPGPPPMSTLPTAGADSSPCTHFLALDKILPRRQFMEFISIPTDAGQHAPHELTFDCEWLAILKKSHSLLSTSRGRVSLPPSGTLDPSAEEVEEVLRLLQAEVLSFLPSATIALSS
jgi:lariat debranching enzyme